MSAPNTIDFKEFRDLVDKAYPLADSTAAFMGERAAPVLEVFVALRLIRNHVLSTIPNVDRGDVEQLEETVDHFVPMAHSKATITDAKKLVDQLMAGARG